MDQQALLPKARLVEFIAFLAARQVVFFDAADFSGLQENCEQLNWTASMIKP